MNVKLVNLRGRIIEANPNEVPELLKRGFVFPPKDQPNIAYTQVYDRGDGVKTPKQEENPQVRVIPKLGDVLERVEEL